jgi:ribosomal protein L40E
MTTTIILENLEIIIGAFVLLIIYVIRSKNQKYRIYAGAWLIAVGVLEVLGCALFVALYVLDMYGVLPVHPSNYTPPKFTPDPYELTVFIPALLSIGIVSIAYGLHVSNSKNPTPQKNVFFGTANPQTSNARTIPQPNPLKIYCYSCGAENQYENNFCSKCGQKLLPFSQRGLIANPNSPLKQ